MTTHNEYNAEQARGKALCDAARPSWAKGVIVAHCAVDKSDIQSDYFHVQDGAFHVLAWSRHDKDRFDEMRKVAGTFAPTAHLGPGCDEYTARVVLAGDVQSNGGCYYTGNMSHWHSEMYPTGDAPRFRTHAEAEVFIKAAGDPGSISFDGTVVPFAWQVDKRSIEHREKYSMGAGYYLRAGHSGGWTVEKTYLTNSAVYTAFAEGRVYLDAPKPQVNTGVDIKAEIARLRVENAALKAQVGATP